MRYVRIKHGSIFDLENKALQYLLTNKCIEFDYGFGRCGYEIVKESNTIEELCDEFVCLENKMTFHNLETITSSCNLKHLTIYGANWTDKGLIYVAKMNENGKFELL